MEPTMGLQNVKQRKEITVVVTADYLDGPRLQAEGLNGVLPFRAEHVEISYRWRAGEIGTRKLFIKLSGTTILANGQPGKRQATKTWGSPSWTLDDLDDELFELQDDIETLVRKLAPAGWEAAA
jgi:hypothetical protein